MLPIEEQSQQEAAGTQRVARLLTGDLGVVVLRALLENGVGYVVSSWQDRPTPIDAAIDDARERVLSPRGVVLRRLRSLSALEPIITAPTGGITGEPPRGAVIFAGRRGLRAVLEQFLAVRSSGGVVGFCFDEDALRIDGALVIDPEPTATGLVEAIDQAFQASRMTGRPALIVLRERSLGMRGTIRCRPELTPNDAAARDSAWRAGHGLVDAPRAAFETGLVTAMLGSDGHVGDVVVTIGPLHRATERALAHIAGRLDEIGAAALAEHVALVATRAVGIAISAEDEAGKLLASARHVCVIGAQATQRAAALPAGRKDRSISAHAVDPGRVRGEQLVRHLAAWLLETVDAAEPDVRAVLQQMVDVETAGSDIDVRSRVPSRGDVLHRGVTPGIAAALTLAQGVVGVPSRMDSAYPTYRTDTGVALTIVPADVFAQHGASSAAPETGPGVFIVTSQAGGVAERAAEIGASIEYIDGSSPRAVAVAIGRACSAPRIASHVIVITEVQRLASPRSTTFGMDPDLVGTERLVTATVPTAATALVDLGDALLSGPTVIALDDPQTHAVLDSVRELSPATWDLRRASHASGRIGRAAWNLRRRAVRAAGGVDL